MSDFGRWSNAQFGNFSLSLVGKSVTFYRDNNEKSSEEPKETITYLILSILSSPHSEDNGSLR